MKDVKAREDQLMDQISVMKQQMRYQSSLSDDQLTENESQSDRKMIDHMALRVGELEHVVIQQKDALVAMESKVIAAERRESKLELQLQ